MKKNIMEIIRSKKAKIMTLQRNIEDLNSKLNNTVDKTKVCQLKSMIENKTYKINVIQKKIDNYLIKFNYGIINERLHVKIPDDIEKTKAIKNYKKLNYYCSAVCFTTNNIIIGTKLTNDEFNITDFKSNPTTIIVLDYHLDVLGKCEFVEGDVVKIKEAIYPYFYILFHNGILKKFKYIANAFEEICCIDTPHIIDFDVRYELLVYTDGYRLYGNGKSSKQLVHPLSEICIIEDNKCIGVGFNSKWYEFNINFDFVKVYTVSGYNIRYVHNTNAIIYDRRVGNITEIEFLGNRGQDTIILKGQHNGEIKSIIVSKKHKKVHVICKLFEENESHYFIINVHERQNSYFLVTETGYVIEINLFNSNM